MSIVLALSGASGAPYFLALLERLKRSHETIELVSSATGRQVLQHETGQSWKQVSNGYTTYSEKQMGAAIASGSHPTQAMVVVPCSMSTLSHIAYGMSENLIHRAAAVQLKERRKLILVTRENPLSLVHLRAMTQATEAGAMIMPASPGFYHHPSCLEDLVHNVVDRILDQIACPDPEIKRWQP